MTKINSIVILMALTVCTLALNVVEMNHIQRKTVDAIERGSFVSGLLTTNLDVFQKDTLKGV